MQQQDILNVIVQSVWGIVSAMKKTKREYQIGMTVQGYTITSKTDRLPVPGYPKGLVHYELVCNSCGDVLVKHRHALSQAEVKNRRLMCSCFAEQFKKKPPVEVVGFTNTHKVIGMVHESLRV